MRRFGLWVVPCLLAACSDSGRGLDLGQESGALVRVEMAWVHRAGTPAQELVWEAQAHFARYQPKSARVVPMLLGYPDDESAAACRVVDAVGELDRALSHPPQVALLDAGRLEVRGGHTLQHLMPTFYPEVVPSLHGVVYGAAADAMPLSLGALYSVEGEGGMDIGPIVGSVVSPHVFPSLQLPAALRLHENLMVRWAQEPAPLGDVRVEVRGAANHLIRCRAPDDGELVVPAALVDELGAGRVTVTVARSSASSLPATGLGQGRLAIELRDIGSVLVEP
jgi:hypothetical protein